jgi:hypothetical protein
MNERRPQSESEIRRSWSFQAIFTAMLLFMLNSGAAKDTGSVFSLAKHNSANICIHTMIMRELLIVSIGVSSHCPPGLYLIYAD